MAGKVASALNELFSSNLASQDRENLSSLVEDYFCFNSGDEDEDMQDGKCNHYLLLDRINE